MSSIFDSGAADLGQSLSGGATGGIAGYVQGLQLKQQMQKQALEELQMQRALKNPHITALAHGAYLVQDPVTGEITHQQSPGSMPGGEKAFLLHKYFANPNDPHVHAALNYVFGNSPEKMDAVVGSMKALADQRTQGAQASDALERERLAREAESRARTTEIAPTAMANRGLTAARTEAAGAQADLSGERATTEGQKQTLYGNQAKRVEAITQPDVSVREAAAEYNVRRAERLRAQVENDAQLTPARKKLLESRAKAAEEAAARHREAGKASSAKATENTVTIGVDALGRSYMKPTFKKPEDSKAFMSTYQQWTQPLKNLDVGMLDFESKAKKLSAIRKTWIEKNHPTEAEVAGFDQAMREAQ